MDHGTICFDRVVCGDLDASLNREWLETNGLGGFSSSTIVGLNTRRYHGLLTIATQPPAGRVLLLSKLEETVTIGGRRSDLSSNQYPGVVHPRGYKFLKQFRLDPFPVFTYEIDGIEIEKRIFMVHGENTTVVEYELRGATDCLLEIRPLVAFRDFHSTTHRNDALNASVEAGPGQAAVTPYDGLPSLHFAHTGFALEKTGHWYENFEYSQEQARGLDYREDLFNPFCIHFNLDQNMGATVIASTERHELSEARSLRLSEVQRRSEVQASSPSSNAIIQTLVAAADHFIVKRGDFKTIIAGYHWFSDWGRDAMIAHPGLTLVTGRYEAAKNILLAFADKIDQGMLPNRFPDAGEMPEYNTVDATLWFFDAVRSLIEYTGDYAFIRERLYEQMKTVIEWHLRGTRYGIRADRDGLLSCGEPGIQLTWMDSKIGDFVVTPRYGKPVDIQALWYNALRTMTQFAAAFRDVRTEIFLGELAALARTSFESMFWNYDTDCLYDVIDSDRRDASIRPNQIFAVSLAHAMLPEDKSKKVVDVVQRELLTPYGLRTLSPRDPRYRSRYDGGVWERDTAYHQGTVWPWLLGPFLTAYVKANGRSTGAHEQAAQWLEAFHLHFRVAGLGQVSELTDAEAPFCPRGCIAQAWSVSELLRAAAEDVFETRIPAVKSTVMGA